MLSLLWKLSIAFLQSFENYMEKLSDVSLFDWICLLKLCNFAEVGTISQISGEFTDIYRMVRFLNFVFCRFPKVCGLILNINGKWLL